MAIPTKKIKIYPNNKLYVTRDIKNDINDRKAAFKNKDLAKLKSLDKNLKKKIREAKQAHRQRLEESFKANNPKRLWDTMKSMTGMFPSNKPIVTENEM